MGREWQSLVFETCVEGVSSALEPELLPDNQFAWGFNMSMRGGKPQTRPAFRYCMALPPGLIQGGEYFGVQGGMIVTQIAGELYRLRIGEDTFSFEDIPLDYINSPIVEQVWMQQTVETLVIQDGQSNAILYNGSTAVRSDPGDDEVPKGRQMAYGNGRLWVAVNDKEVLAGDIRTNTPGSELFFTESQYLSGGGRLYFPRGITGMSFIPTTGTTDYGALLIFGKDYTESIRADISQRDLWASYPGFVTNVLRNIGCAGQWSITQVNQDLYWRDSVGGIRSLRSSLADESGPGNSPISREVSRLVDFDSAILLNQCSAINFDNRLLMTSSPYLHINGGVAWKDIISLDFAPVSTMRGKSFPSYNGTWTGLRVIKFVTGQFNNVPRAFALTSDDNGNNQLWEIEETIRTSRGDQYISCSDGTGASEESPITCFTEYPRRDFGSPKNRKRLERCDVWLSDLDGDVELTVYWRTDNNQQWTEWDTVTVCAQTTDDSTETPHVWKNLLNQQRPQVKTFTIPDGTDPVTSYGKQTGYEFQIRLEWRGRAKIDRMMLHATVLEDPDYANREEVSATCIENNVQDNEISYEIPTDGCAVLELSVSDGSGSATIIPVDSTYDLGEFEFEDARNFTFTITNDGEGTLELGEITLTSGSGEFDIVSQPASVVAAGDSTTFTIRYYAVVPGTSTAQISIPNNTNLDPYDFEVTAGVLEPDEEITYESRSGDAQYRGYIDTRYWRRGPSSFAQYANSATIPDWFSGTTYSSGDRCFYSGKFYRSLQGTNLNQQPDSSPAYWSECEVASHWLNQALSGHKQACFIFGNETCTTPAVSTNRNGDGDWSGSSSVDHDTGTETWNGVLTQYTNNNSVDCARNVVGVDTTNQSDVLAGLTSFVGSVAAVFDETVATYGQEGCVPSGGSSTNYTGTALRTISGAESIWDDLTPDGVPAESSDSGAWSDAWTPTGVTVSRATINISNLIDGTDYQVTVNYSASAGSAPTSDVYLFTASGTTHQIIQEIPFGVAGASVSIASVDIVEA